MQRLCPLGSLQNLALSPEQRSSSAGCRQPFLTADRSTGPIFLAALWFLQSRGQLLYTTAGHVQLVEAGVQEVVEDLVRSEGEDPDPSQAPVSTVSIM